MPDEGGDEWNWWEVFDIITTIDDELEYLNEVADKQLEVLKSISEGQPGGGSGQQPGDDGISVVEGVEHSANVLSSAITASSFKQESTDEPIAVEPGDNRDILKVNLKSSALWYEVGSKDHTDTGYQYVVDDTDVLGSRQSEPIGLYNNVYRFPHPIVANDKIVVNVRRDSSANGPADYYSKVRYVPIPDGLAAELSSTWRSI